MELFKTPNFNYIKYHKVFFGLSALLGLLTIGALFYRGKNILSIDFTGGALIQGYFEKEAVPLEKIRANLSEVGLPGAELQGVPEHNAVILRFKTKQSNEERQGVETRLKDGFARVFPTIPLLLNGRNLWGRWWVAI